MEIGSRRGRTFREVESLRRRVAELEAEKDALGEVLDHVGVGVAVIDERGRPIRSNRLWHEFVPGTIPSADAEPGDLWRAIDDQGAVVPSGEWPAAQALRGQTVSGARFLHRLSDGSDVWVRVSASPLRADHGRVVEAVCTVQELDSIVQTEEALRRSQDLLTDELLAARQLQETSQQTASPDDGAPLVERILDAAVVIMRSDFASIQTLDEETGELRMLGMHGFSPAATSFWEVVTLSSRTICAEALRTGRRAISADVEKTAYMAGTEDLERYREARIRSCQTTPLRTRDGRIIGMLSTHWHEPHQPAAYDLASLDILARQAADLIEHWQAEERQGRLARNLENERQLVLRLSAPILRLKERLLLLPLIGVIDSERAEAIALDLLDRVRTERASIVVIDSSAVAQIERSLGDWLVRTVQAVQYLGSQVVLTGIPARLARSLLPLVTDLAGVTIAGDLQEGLEQAMARVESARQPRRIS